MANAARSERNAPCPPSPVIAGIEWHWETLKTAAPGSDLWPVTWGKDGNLYAAWGDGGGFGGTDADGRVSMGFARIEGPPDQFIGINVNGGKNPEHRASFPDHGKTSGILSAGGILYAWVNEQNGAWPDVDYSLARSEDSGATWRSESWKFLKGKGRFKPDSFLQFGQDGTGVPDQLKGFVYFYGYRQGDDADLFLIRAPDGKLRDRERYQFFSGLAGNRPQWSPDDSRMQPVFAHGGGGTVVYDPALRRYLLTRFRGPGQLGIFDGPEPWGPWTTVADYEDWGGMGVEGEGLTCSFPRKWMEPDGLTMWCIFSAYGEGARRGIEAHDRFNLVKATLRLRR